nr:MAG TPA: hypothetical protein [Caudoviricetes sp.]
MSFTCFHFQTFYNSKAKFLYFPLKRRFPFACYFRGIFVLSGFRLFLDTFNCLLNYRRSMGLILARFAFRLCAAKPRLKFRGVFCLLNRICWKIYGQQYGLQRLVKRQH